MNKKELIPFIELNGKEYDLEIEDMTRKLFLKLSRAARENAGENSDAEDFIEVMCYTVLNHKYGISKEDFVKYLNVHDKEYGIPATFEIMTDMVNRFLGRQQVGGETVKKNAYLERKRAAAQN